MRSAPRPSSSPAERSERSAAAPVTMPHHRLSRLIAEVRWLVLLACTVFLLLSLASYNPQDPGWTHALRIDKAANLGGIAGAWVADIAFFFFGVSSYWLILLLARRILSSYRRMRAPHTDEKPSILSTIGHGALDLIAFVCILAASASLESMRFWSLFERSTVTPGGVTGHTIALKAWQVLGFTGGTLALLLILCIGLSLFFRFSWIHIAEHIGDKLIQLCIKVKQRYEERRDRKVGEVAALRREGVLEQDRARIEEHEPIHIIEPVVSVPPSVRVEKEKQRPLFQDFTNTSLPPLSLLDAPPVSPKTISAQTLEYTSRLIEKKLKDFGIEISVVAAYPGPVITRYEIDLATGVKGSQVLNLAKDLARALSLVSVRVVETIPGKNYMGLELPNPNRQTVFLTEILGSEIYAQSASNLTVALGKDISGKPIVADLGKMPHLLVAGTTGSGKSVGVNAMILSLLYKATPDQVRLILIDPKMLELSIYDGVPHLLCPVVTDMRLAGHALNWTVGEMERRYKLMSKLGVRNLAGYNSKIQEAAAQEEKIPNPFSLTPDAPEPLEPLPSIVVVIDELADLMMVVGKKVEELIARIAQKARAAGIHLILATQRPSVDVITGLIKANIPTRIAFQVSSKIDSRTILDQQGAESLLGMGDMLYLAPGMGIPTRVHGAFVADGEVHRVVEKLKEQGEPAYIDGLLEGNTAEGADGIEGGGESAADGEADPLYDQAVDIVIKNRRASISLVQRHLRIGYNRAARLLEQMERSGVVSVMGSNGNREVLAPNQEE